jgi:hypothetical protein
MPRPVPEPPEIREEHAAAPYLELPTAGPATPRATRREDLEVRTKPVKPHQWISWLYHSIKARGIGPAS